MMQYDRLIVLAKQLGFTDEVAHWEAEREKALAAAAAARNTDAN